MQYSDEDIEDLFRKAADGYPLKVVKEDWDAVSGKIIVQGSVLPATKLKKAKINYGYLLLVMTFIGVCAVFMFEHTGKSIKQVTGNPDPATAGSGLTAAPAIVKTESINSLTVSSSRNKKNPAIQPVASQSEKIALNSNAVTEYLGRKPAKDLSWLNELTPVDGEEAKDIDATTDFHPENKFDVISDSFKIVAALIDDKQHILSSAGKKKSFYLGIVTGPLFNQVKNQGFGRTGIYTGLLAGVKVTHKLSVETGVFVAQRKYHSDGQYFSMDIIKSSMPAGMEIKYLTGKMTTIEIPVKVKYDFLTNTKSKWFATVAMSSYIITNESNQYNTMLNGTPGKMEAEYRGKEKIFTPAPGLSLGYQYTIWKKTSVRIEPYVQFPCKGIGVGALPLLSTGVAFSVTIPVTR